jgi:hypothetical protein
LTGPNGQRIEVPVNQQYVPLGLSASGKVDAPLVFAGYGVVSEEQEYDDFKGIDVEGKVVMVLRKTPRPDSTTTPFDGAKASSHAALTTKMSKANLHKAAAVIFVNDAVSAKDEDTLMPFSYLASSRSEKLPAIHLRRAVADSLLQSTLGRSLKDIEADIDRNLKPQSAPLTGWNAKLEVTLDRLTAKNVVGVIEGEGPKANETVVIGAHYDHLGYGGFGSLARGLKNPAIHHGADDNASGTTALIELARRLAALPKRDRRLVFIAFSAEESGLLGSAHYCRSPLFPLNDTVGMLNLDMVGRLSPDKETKKDRLIVYGTGTAKHFDELIENLNKKYDFKLQKVATGTGPSDHASFYAKNIPVFFLFTDTHVDYHKPTDTSEKINVVGMRKVTELAEELAADLLTRPERPEFTKVGGGATQQGPRGNVPRLGVRPAYGDDKDGVLLDDVTEGGIASKAGLKAGDRIVEIGGKEVKNLEAYMASLASRKKGDSFEVAYLRDGKKQTTKVTLE